MKRNINYEADFLFGSFAKIYGAITSLVLATFYPNLWNSVIFQMRFKKDMTTKLKHCISLVVIGNAFCYSSHAHAL